MRILFAQLHRDVVVAGSMTFNGGGVGISKYERHASFHLQAYGIIASFYNAVGNQEKCESSYVKYIKLIEKFYLQDSLEASNAYFLVGVYYFEESMTHKSIACFRKALAIR